MIQLLKGISDANNNLLVYKNLSISIKRAIENIAKATNVDRCYVFENQTIGDDKILLHYVFEWCKDGVAPYLGDPRMNGHQYASFPGLFETLSKNKPLFGIVKNASNPVFKEIMTMQGIISYLFLPIFSEGKFWGWIGFDDCLHERSWKKSEVYALHTVAKNIGLRLNQDYSYKKLQLALTEKDVYLENSSQVAWIFNNSTNEINFSFNWQKLFGLQKSLPPQSFQEWESNIYEADLRLFKKKMKSYLEGSQKKMEGIFRYKTIDDKYLWLKYNLQQFFDHEEESKKILGSFIDITNLKNRELEIKRQKTEYENLSNNISEIIFKTSDNGNLIFLNANWKKFTGIDKNLALNKNIISFFSKTTIENNKYENLALFFKNKHNETINRQFKVLLKTVYGYDIWVLVIINYHKNNNRYVGTITDVNENELLKQKLNQSEEKFSFIANNTSDVIMVHELSGKIDFISESCEQMIGYKANELDKTNPYDYIHPEDIPKVEKLHQEIIKNKRKIVLDFRYKHKDGHWIWLETALNPVVEKNIPIAFISTSRDISESKKFNKQIQGALKKEIELNKLKSNFVSLASHQFRTPLTVLYSNIELLDQIIKDNGNFDVKIKNRAIIRMKNEVARMTELINNFLIYGKYDAGHIKKKINKLSLHGLINNIIQKSFNANDTGRDIKLSISGKQKDILSDEGLLEHIFTNLISNAIKYSDKPKNPEILFHYKIKNILIEIKDYGIGIPKEGMQNLFKSFHRAENTDNIKGSGLGLVIVKEFLSLLNGKIKVESSEGIGTKISIEIPYE